MRTCAISKKPCDCPGAGPCPLDVADERGGRWPLAVAEDLVASNAMVARLAGTDGVDVDLWIRPGAHGRVAGGTTVPSDVVRGMTEQAWADFRAYFGRIGYVRVGHMPPPAFGRLSRIARSIIEPMKSWTIDVSHSAKMTSSPDLSPVQGKVTIVGGESKDA